MAKLTLNDITAGNASTTLINANNALIEAALENTQSLDDTSPNARTANLDMNGFNILNQGNPITIEGWSWEGAWVTSTVYTIGDVVEDGGTSYICIEAHTSGTFATDLAALKWELVATASLPDQSTHSGKFLTTDGATASWGVIATNYVAIGGDTMTGDLVMSTAAINHATPVTIASAATPAIGAAAGNSINMTGTTSITGFDDHALGTQRLIVFSGILTLTYDANALILPTNTDIVTAVGDTCLMEQIGTGPAKWRCQFYQRRDGKAVASDTATTTTEGVVELATLAEVQTGTDTSRVPSVESMRDGLWIATSENTTGTEVEVTGIPSWASVIIITLVNVGTNGTNNLLLRLGDSGGYESTGYVGCSTLLKGSGFPFVTFNSTAFHIKTDGNPLYGVLTLTKLGAQGSVTWCISGTYCRSATSSMTTQGGKTLTGELDRVKLLINGANTFDAGTWGVKYS
jgi:hypothetical protein